MDLVHYHMIELVTDISRPEESRRKIQQLNERLTGPLGRTRRVVDPQAGFAPPSWWQGDGRASQSTIAAAAMLKRRR